MTIGELIHLLNQYRADRPVDAILETDGLTYTIGKPYLFENRVMLPIEEGSDLT